MIVPRFHYWPHFLAAVLLVVFAISQVRVSLSVEAFQSLAKLDSDGNPSPLTPTAAPLLGGWKDIHVFYGDANHLRAPPRKARSQTRQDDLVMGLLNHKSNGYFLDLAANDATSLSNTYRLEKELGWNGICVEPNPSYWRRLTYRKCEIVAAVVGKDRMEEIQFVMHDGTGRTPSGGIVGFDNQINRPKSQDKPVPLYTVPLREILGRFHAPSRIDYLSLDVEGAEYFVMKDFPYQDYIFDIMTVERPTTELVDLLYEKGYKYLAGNNEGGQETVFCHSTALAHLNLTAIDKVGWLKGTTKWIQVGEKFLDKPTVLAAI